MLCSLAAAGGCFPLQERSSLQLQFIHCIYLDQLFQVSGKEKKKSQLLDLILPCVFMPQCELFYYWQNLFLRFMRAVRFTAVNSLQMGPAVINLYFTPTLFLLAFLKAFPRRSSRLNFFV